MKDALADPIAEFFANPLVSTGITLVGIVVVALWLAASWWAYQDAARRSESTLAAFLAAAWIVVSTPLMLPVALAVYSFARPQLTASDHRTRALVRQLGVAAAEWSACASCQSPIETSWLRCPACSNWLTAPCRSCGVWSARDLEACPFCGSEDQAASAVHPVVHPVLAGYGTAAAGASSAAAVVVGAQRDRVASSARPFSYATSRDISSVSS